ncbi:MAG: pantoate--beta-alanine ligase [Chitinophagales bacterium]
MIEFKNSENLNKWCKAKRGKGFKIGYVPTMGALHKGHISLIDMARRENDLVICSIFVNPTQFNEPEDFDKYPITIEKDKDLLFHAGCDVVFIPKVSDIYPVSKNYDLTIDLGEIANVLEGKHRPGHFEGVMQVVKRLLEIVEPSVLYLGKKDYQQYLILKKMVEYYKFDTEVIQCPIVRESDGLAMSSRNQRLTEKERIAAVLLSKALFAIKTNFENSMPTALTEKFSKQLNLDPLIEVEYLDIVTSESLTKITEWNETQSAVACIAAKVGSIRLIDNVTIY